jgi:hypothetical protein
MSKYRGLSCIGSPTGRAGGRSTLKILGNDPEKGGPQADVHPASNPVGPGKSEPSNVTDGSNNGGKAGPALADGDTPKSGVVELIDFIL